MTKMIDFQAPRVWLAPMSGSTDAPMRRQAARFGAPGVVSEMVAGEQLAAARPDTVRRTCRHDGFGQWIVQLAGRRPTDMRAGAQTLAAAGVDVIDINMGCPSKQVTGGQSGSALMRDLDLARDIIEATIEGAGGLPVTLKTRLGWDDALLNAPDLAQIAEKAGVRMITIHARTRRQFYKGAADWARVRDTVSAVALPVLVNGDIDGPETARAALETSCAYGVMVGRAAMGRPWLVGAIAASLEGRAWTRPGLREQVESLGEQVADSVDLYGEQLGVRVVRKHVSAFIDTLPATVTGPDRRGLRARLCRIEQAKALIDSLRAMLTSEHVQAAA